jgi:hypothetical protein
MHDNTKSPAPKRKRRAPSPELPPAEAPCCTAIEPLLVPHSRKELAEAILAARGLVQVGRELLESTSEKGASVRLRVYEMLVDWLYGPEHSSPSEDRRKVRIIWDIPGPDHERESNEENPDARA